MPPRRRDDQPAQGNPPAGNNPLANNPLANNPPANNPPTVALICTKEYTAVNRLPERSHLTDDNWYDWMERMNHVFTSCDITGYIDGTKCVAPEQDGIGARNWVKNDTWAQQIIMDNVSATQMNHIRSKRTAHAMYEGLASTHEDMVFYTVNNIENLLQTAKATDTYDLLKHLDNLKGLRDRMNEFPNPDFHLPDVRFKTIISNSLLRSW
jgi:gag-polypeptide of LTR copia-type